VLGLMGDLEEVVASERIDRVVVALADRRRGMPLDALLRVRLSGVEVIEEPRVHEEIAGKLPVEDLRPSWLIFSDGFSRGAFAKRLFDIVVASIGIVLSAPLMIATALAVRLTSSGPILFRQIRVGQGGREFTLMKFRSMCADAEKDGKPQWAQKSDPRVTRVGRILRSTRLDELPQMFNVLSGSGHHRLGAGALPLRERRGGSAGEAALRHVLRQAPLAGPRSAHPVRDGRRRLPARYGAVVSPSSSRR
jgi:hypothetical protein